ncbi:hypothetical protein [Anabaena sp. UHCC 0451]|uniref:hypothetical protein n=1 Tax=Anabaena sp. UHCC 0451 TaxID=2055235 RepID=UPI002B20CF20|nr:hypothetical protein [Anabaena sp. UHCC 0451]MEA5579360.1 hypothetical protein [Anabaena sp. UHCC 0451]
MSNQISQFNLVELSTEEQEFISGGGYSDYSPCYKPRECCEYTPYSEYNNYGN